MDFCSGCFSVQSQEQRAAVPIIGAFGSADFGGIGRFESEYTVAAVRSAYCEACMLSVKLVIVHSAGTADKTEIRMVG